MIALPPFHVGGTIYFEFQTKKPSDGVTPIAPNSIPTVTVFKNGSATGESSTVSALSGVTGGYSVSFNPAGEAETDLYTLRVNAAITDADYNNGNAFTHSVWFLSRCIAVERGSDTAPDNAAISTINAKLGTPAGVSMSADIASVKVDTGNLASRITSTLFSGITQLSRWLGALAGKTADSTTLDEIQATMAGAGYSNTTDSLEALRDSSAGLTTEQAAALARIDAKAALITGAKLSVAGAVTPGGDISLVIGDDRVVAADSELLRTITDTGGALFARLDAAESITFGAGRNGVADQITGTVTASYSSSVTTLTIEIDAASIDADAIASEDYTYQIQRVTADGDHVVEVSGNLTLLTRYVARTT